MNDEGYLNDVIQPNQLVDNDIRPNQIFVLSLPFELLTKAQQKKVFQYTKKHLFTPYGLRSLNVEHKDFKPIYQGDPWHRDTSYHQGTVWSWLLGDYWLAYLKLSNYSTAAKKQVEAEMKALQDHFYQDNCMHGISEIFDGLSPKAGRGTIQQAWSVGALIMVLELMQAR